jgi:hypothetical protein
MDMCVWLLQVATLRSAVKLEQEQQFLIAKKLQELTGSKNIKLKPVIDQSLIAGESPLGSPIWQFPPHGSRACWGRKQHFIQPCSSCCQYCC